MAQTTYEFDTSHSHIAFTVRHMVFAKVRGEFTKWSGSAAIDDTDPAKSSISATIEVASINTHEEKRDAHLRSADFFDADTHAQMTFRGTGISAKGKGKLELVGDLTIRGTTKSVTLEVEELGRGKDPWGNERVAYSAQTSIDRREFGLKWNQALEAGGLLVGEKVEIAIDVELTKKA